MQAIYLQRQSAETSVIEYDRSYANSFGSNYQTFDVLGLWFTYDKR